MIELVVHEFDNVEVIEYDLSLRKVFGEPCKIRICHSHCNKSQFVRT